MGTYVKPRMHVHAEHKAKRAIEATSPRELRGIPDGAFVALAGGALAAALVLRLLGRKGAARFVSDWAPAILLVGIYSRIGRLDRARARGATT